MLTLGRAFRHVLLPALVSAVGLPAWAQDKPASSMVAAPVAATVPAGPGAVASAPASAAKKPTVDQLLSREPVVLNFQDVPIKDALVTMGEKYGFDVRNAYDFTALPDEKDATERPMRITLVNAKMTARQAINLMNGSLLMLGYSIAETVRGEPPRVVLTVLQSGRDTTKIQVYFGQDPAQIPETEEIRTQVMTLSKVTAADAKDDIETVLGKTDITANEGAKQLVITDTASHIHQAAATLMLLEKKAARDAR